MNYENAFKINYYKVSIQLMPIQWRKPLNVAFVKFLTILFDLLLVKLLKTRKQNLYLLQHDGRIGKIEKVLNDKFDKIERRIGLIDGDRKNQTYSYFSQENKTQLTTPFVSYFPEEVAEFSADFIVEVPLVVGLIDSDYLRLNSLVKFYADKDKHFIIKKI